MSLSGYNVGTKEAQSRGSTVTNADQSLLKLVRRILFKIKSNVD